MLLIQSSLIFLVLTVLTGILYPLTINSLGGLFWPDKTKGSLVFKNNMLVGSHLIAQNFSTDSYFWPRPSASNFSALPAMASNLGPTSKDLYILINNRRHNLALKHEKDIKYVPEILLTSSGSGLDPHISLQAAFFQIERIGKARGLNAQNQDTLKNILHQVLKQPQLGFLGQARLNVLELNLILDKTFAEKSAYE